MHYNNRACLSRQARISASATLQHVLPWPSDPERRRRTTEEVSSPDISSHSTRTGPGAGYFGNHCSARHVKCIPTCSTVPPDGVHIWTQRESHDRRPIPCSAESCSERYCLSFFWQP